MKKQRKAFIDLGRSLYKLLAMRFCITLPLCYGKS